MKDYWDQPIENLPLGTKELKALKLLNVKCFREFKEFDLSTIFILSGYGRGTYTRLQQIRSELLKEEVSDSVVEVKNSKISFDDVIWVLSTRTQRVLKKLGINTINDLLGLTGPQVLKCRGAGRKVLSEIFQLQKKLIKDGYSYRPDIRRDPITFTEVFGNISTRTQRALKQLNIDTFEKLLNISEKDIIETPTLGIVTWHEIRKLQNNYTHQRTHIPVDWLDTPANDFAIKLLPLFSNRELSISDIDLHPSYIPYLNLEKLSLPDWITPYIEKMKIDTLGALLLVPANVFLNMGGFGKSKLSEIQELIYSFLIFNLNQHDYYTKTARLEYLNNFPFYNDIFQPTLDINSIDSSYCPKQLLNSLNLPVRAMVAFKKKSIYTFGELLITTPASLFKQGNFGVETLRETRHIISKHILEIPQKADLIAEANSLADIVAKYLSNILSKRPEKVISMRLGLLNGNPKTLEQIANELNLTRERIRQIQIKAEAKLKIATYLVQIEDIKVLIENVIKKAGGRIHALEMLNIINNSKGWKDTSSNSNLIIFLSNLFESFNVDNDIAYLPDFPCDYCNRPMNLILNEMPNNTEMKLTDLSNMVVENCNKCKCQFYIDNQLYFSVEYLQYYMASRKTISDKYICRNGNICSKDLGRIKYGYKHEAIEQIMISCQKPLHFSEVAKIYNEYCNKSEKHSIRSVHGILGNIENVVLWDRGTFMHKNNIICDGQLLEDIWAWITNKLNDGIEFISIAGAYQHYKKRCNDIGIISETALYSYLRLYPKHTVFLNRYPFVTKVNKRINVQKFLEEYVIEKGGEAQINDLDKLLNDYCFRNPLGSILGNVPNLLLKDDDTIIHIDNLNMNLHKLHEICKYAQELLRNANLVTVLKIYKDKMVSCKLLGITGPRLLFSCIQNFGQEYVATGRYPQLKDIDNKNIKGLGIQNEYEIYVKNHGPCGRDELIRHFVDQLGYSERSIETIPYYTEKVLFYASGCYVHIDTLGWDRMMQKRLLTLLHNNYLCMVNDGKCYARLKDILDYKYADLPEIKGNIPWTIRLLQSMVESSDEFKFLGNAKDAYIEIAEGSRIQNLSDLIYHRIYTYHDGAINKEVLEHWLNKEGVIKKNLTPNMINCSDKLIIKGNDIIAKDLVDNV